MTIDVHFQNFSLLQFKN